MSAAAENRRDTTRALELARKIRDYGHAYDYDEAAALVQILEDMDARTGTRDPSKRPARKAVKRPIR